jgi:hypothetical protein
MAIGYQQRKIGAEMQSVKIEMLQIIFIFELLQRKQDLDHHFKKPN